MCGLLENGALFQSHHKNDTGPSNNNGKLENIYGVLMFII